jgi:hypothetical protein
MEEKVQILSLNPQNFEFQSYIDTDTNLIAISESDTVFQNETDYIELYIYDESQKKIFPSQGVISLSSYKVLQGDVVLDPEQDLKSLSFNDSTYNILYTFYRKRLASDINQNYFIREISSDRTEIRLDSNTISNLDIVSSTNEFIQYRNNAEYFVDFLLNFSDNKTIIANNIKLEDEGTDDPTILIKLYEPLPQEFNLKSILWVVEELSDPLLYQVKFPVIIKTENDFSFIKGPNFNLNIRPQLGNSSQLSSLNDLIDSNVTSSARQIRNILDKKEINININHENFSEFVNFSSAKTRLENFYYKAGLIESYNNYISSSLGEITGGSSTTSEFSASKAIYDKKIESITDNFDDYEYFLYYNSGSQYSWPKSNQTPPFKLYSTGSTEVLNWIGSADPNSLYYGGMALSASNYDEENNNWLYNAIPEYLRDDPSNEQYKLFIDMVGQHYDNIWIYTKDITKKFDADNRLEYGISKDLIDAAIKDFGIKLYSNNFDNKDLYTAFLGLTPSGSLFPFPEMTGSFPTPSGYEYIDTQISSSDNPIAIDGVNKRLYKRIYHNLPYLLKTKGTIAGLRALITSYGIPDTILRINEFGGKNRLNPQDWDLQQRVFNYAFDTEGKYIISSSFDPNTNLAGGYDSPRTVQLRFKTRGIPSETHFSQSLYHLESGVSALVLEYTGSSLASGSYSGSIPNPENQYGVLKFIPDSINPEYSASLVLPFFDGNWWSVQTTIDTTNTASLYTANQINNKLGFTGSSTTTGLDSNYYFNAENIYIPNNGSNLTIGGKSYTLFSGSLQEVRYYNSVLSSSKLYDYTMNPYSFEGNATNTAPDELIFRADLGTTLNTGSTTSIHPKVTGSAEYPTSSFASNSEFYISSSNFIINREYIYQDQVIGGIKNRVTDKIIIEDNIVPSGDVLSPMRSIQQTSFVSSSYTPDVNYLEVAFSPQDQINDDINAQMGYFNIGEYIGDPRQISSSGHNYPDLDKLRDAYFNKYIKSYNVLDFIRLIKFFDNSLFKMIKDFTPARTSLSSGVVVKQHILERNRVSPTLVTSSLEQVSGSIKPQSRNYNTGSGDVGQYEYISGSSIYRFNGGTGGSFERFNGLEFSPSASAYGLSNRFNITQSYSESKTGKLGQENITVFDQKEFYDGEFSGSTIVAVTQSLGPECIVYLKNPDKPIRYYPYFFSGGTTFSNNPNFANGTVQGLDFLDRRNAPLAGQAWIFSRYNDGISSSDPTSQRDVVFNIKLSGTDADGNEVRDFITGAETIQFIFPEGIKTYFVNGVVLFATHAAITVNREAGDYLFASSSNGGTENWSLRAYGNYTSPDGTNPGFDPNTQGKFHAASNTQTQVFRYYNGGGDQFIPSVVGDPLGLFNTGSIDFESINLLNNDIGYYYGTYTIPRTPNIPWIISCSISYSSSGNPTSGLVEIDTHGVYHSGSFYGVGSDHTNPITLFSQGINSIPVSSEGYPSAISAQSGDLDMELWYTSSADPLSNTTYLYDDLNIVLVSSRFNGNGLYYRIGENHTGFINSLGQLSSLNIFQNSGDPTPVALNYGSTGSIVLPSFTQNTITLDPSFFTASFNSSLKGNDFHPDRVPYFYSSSTDMAGATGQIRFNNATIGSATQIAISLTDANGTFNATALDPNLTGATSYKIYNFTNPNSSVDVSGVTVDTISGVRIVQNFSSIAVTGSFSDSDVLGLLPNTVTDRGTGNPEIHVGGTASLSWDYSQFSIGGQPPISNELSVLAPLPLSGSATSTRGNNDFVVSVTPNGDYADFSETTQGGVYRFNQTEWTQYASNLYGSGNFQPPILEISYTIKAFSDPESLDDLPVTTVVQQSSAFGSSEWVTVTGTARTINGGTLALPNTFSRTINVSPNQLLVDVGGDIRLRLAIGGENNQEVRYYVDSFQVVIKTFVNTGGTLDQFNQYGGNPNVAGVGNVNTTSLRVSQGTVSNYQTQVLPGTTINKVGYAESIVQPKLYITGSYFSPKQLVGVAPGIQFPITNNSTFNFSSSYYAPIFATKSLYRLDEVTYDEYIYNTNQFSGTITFEYLDPNLLTESSDVTIYPSQSITISGSAIGGINKRVIIPTVAGETPTITAGTATLLTSSLGKTLYPTINTSASMYYPEFEFSNRINSGLLALTRRSTDLIPVSNPDYPKLIISNSIKEGEEGFRMTGSLRVHKGNADDKSTLGPIIFSQQFIVPNSESIDSISISGSIGLPQNTFRYNDSFRMSVSLDKGINSFLDITEYTMSLFPSESKFATITEDFAYYSIPDQPEGADYGIDVYGGSSVVTTPGYGKYSKPTLTDLVLSSYYGAGVLPFAIQLDCQPLLNNFNAQRASSYLMDVDYNTAGGGSFITTGNFTAGSSVFTVTTSAGIRVGQEVKYEDGQFEGIVLVREITDGFISVNKVANSNAGSNQSITFLTPSYGSLRAVNYNQIISGSARRATVPDSNYYQESWTTLRYDGSKAQSNYLNVWTPTDFGTYGQLPVIELRNAYFAYFSSIQDPYPILNDTTRVNLSYLIDPQGNALPPSLKGVAQDIIEKTFPVNGNSRISLNIESSAQDLQELNEENILKVVGKYPVPVMYSQTSSRGYATGIPLSGSGRVSLYDDPGSSQSFTDYTFTVEGTASLTPGRNVIGILNPSSNYVRKDFGGGLVASQSYQLNDYPTGAIAFASESYVATGEDTSQMQYISIQTSIPTTYIYSGDWKKKGNFFKKSKSKEYIEFTLKLGLKYTYDSETSYIPFVAEDVRLRVWKGGVPYDAGSVVDKIAFEEASPTSVQTQRGSFWRKSRSTTAYQSTSGLKLDRENKLHAKINEDVVYAILNAKGLGGGGIEEGGSIEGLEWIIVANSGENIYKKESYLQWEIDSSILPGNNNKNTILPSSFTGPKGATKISMIGSKTHLLETDNTASAPYWKFANELEVADRPTTDTTHNYIYMSSSIFNEAYGGAFTQGILPYNPGPYEGFPNNQEPLSTKIGEPYSTLVLEEGDEIRFGNNENYSYKILTVYSPQENIHPNDKGYIKLELDRVVPQSVNKDFFLIRRYIESANSVILEMPYPYTLTLSGSSFLGGKNIQTLKPETFTSPGILFPSYPIPEVENSASILINNLISKGVIT